MSRLVRFLMWRPQQPALARWAEAVVLTALALVSRTLLGTLHGANPGVTFFPAIIAATLLLGWSQGLFVLIASVAAGWYWFIPPGMILLPAVWLLVGCLCIGIVTAFRATAQELNAANERQRMLFQVARQRVARTPQAEFTVPQEIKAGLSPARAEAVRILEDAARRIASAGDVHSRLNQSGLLPHELDSILRDAVASVIDRRSVNLTFDVDEVALTFDLMSTVTMLVLEIASESQKNVFRHGRGTQFSVALKALPGDRAALTIKDDGAIAGDSAGAAPIDATHKLEIVRTLVNQMRGTLRTSFVGGAEFAIEFPVNRTV